MTEKRSTFLVKIRRRLLLTADGYWSIIITRPDRSAAKTPDNKGALLDSMIAYSGRYTINGDKITTRVDVSWNEVFSGALQNQTRFFNVEGDKLTIRTGLIESTVRPGQRT